MGRCAGLHVSEIAIECGGAARRYQRHIGEPIRKRAAQPSAEEIAAMSKVKAIKKKITGRTKRLAGELVVIRNFTMKARLKNKRPGRKATNRAK
jgi:hypothetical protein